MEDMAMDTQRSRAMHNFSFPGSLRWGNQRSLRCIKVDSDRQVAPPLECVCNGSDSSGHRQNQESSQLQRTTGDRGGEEGSPHSDFVFLGSLQMGSTPPRVTRGRREIGGDEDDGAVLLDRRKADGQSKVPILKEGRKGEEVSVSLQSLTPHAAAMSVGGDTKKPWNLRKRRAAYKNLVSGFVSGVNCGASFGGKAIRADGAATTDKSLRSGGGNRGGEKTKREKFSVALSKREIEEDFFAFTSHKPPRRPKKRAKNVQKELDTLFPGLWLTEVTPELYKVSGAAP